ncbi:MAG: condensation domain-containing protein, partial [Betaproteobacteria bacterium]
MSFIAEGSTVATPNQRGLWLLDRLAPLSNAYNLARSVTLVGPLDDGALRKAFDAMVQRHEVLRTRFADVDDEPVPVVASAPEFALHVEDLSDLAHDQQEARADALTRQEARTPFDLSAGPLLRGRLLRFAAQKHRLLVTLHHIIADDASLVVFWRELAASYEASVLGLPSPLPRLPMQFSDHAQRQHARLGSAEMREQLAYWKQMLKDPPVLALPVDHSRPVMPSYRGHLARFSLTEELTRDLRALSRTQGATMFTTLLAALQVLLYRYCGQKDITIGVPVRGRNEPDLTGLIGYFVNMLVIRADLSGAPTFAEHLARAQDRTTAAYAHWDVPFDILVKELGERRDPSRNPLFQVSLTQWSTESGVLRLAGLEAADIVAVDTGSAMFDLSLTVVEQAGRCHFSIEYAADLFDASSIDRMTGHFKTLLEGIVAHPDMPIADIPLLTDEERHLLLVGWNDTHVPYPEGETLAMRFEAQVRRTPDAVALTHGDQRFSYAQINAQANRLATYLRDRVDGPDVPVAVCMERSIHSLVGVLAVLKVGAIYVPIDPQHPEDRIAFMLDDARAKVVLVNESTRHRFASTDPRIVCMHADREAIARCAGDDASTPRAADALAYVIYTSGSTGVPKGVQISNRGFCNHVSWITERLQLGPSDRVLQFTSISFDASLWEMVAPLCVGASLSLLRPGGERDIAYLAKVLHDEHLTVLQVVPSMLRALLKDSQLQRCSHLRYIVCGGEPLDYELVGRLQRLLPWVRQGNFYGPTETSTDAT